MKVKTIHTESFDIISIYTILRCGRCVALCKL
jgi:hypothetical protein